MALEAQGINMTREEEARLIELYQRLGSLKARDALIKYQMGIIVNQAKALSKGDYELARDLTNEGVVGVLECLPKFDLSKNYRLSSYVGSTVRGKMLDYIREKPDLMRKGVWAEEEDLTTIPVERSIVDDLIHSEIMDKIWEKLCVLEPLRRDSFLASYRGCGENIRVAKKYGRAHSNISFYSLGVLKELKKELCCED